jgi:hypothetical protein
MNQTQAEGPNNIYKHIPASGGTNQAESTTPPSEKLSQKVKNESYWDKLDSMTRMYMKP